MRFGACPRCSRATPAPIRRSAARGGIHGDSLFALHDGEGLRAFLSEAERIREAVAVLGPAIDRAVGLLHLWEGDAAGARLSLEQALAEYERLSNPFETARTREYLAEA